MPACWQSSSLCCNNNPQAQQLNTTGVSAYRSHLVEWSGALGDRAAISNLAGSFTCQREGAHLGSPAGNDISRWEVIHFTSANNSLVRISQKVEMWIYLENSMNAFPSSNLINSKIIVFLKNIARIIYIWNLKFFIRANYISMIVLFVVSIVVFNIIFVLILGSS